MPRLCRVLPGFEPASAGGSLLRNAALAQAYRVISIKLRTLLIGIGSKRGGNITYTEGHDSYTIIQSAMVDIN